MNDVASSRAAEEPQGLEERTARIKEALMVLKESRTSNDARVFSELYPTIMELESDNHSSASIRAVLKAKGLDLSAYLYRKLKDSEKDRRDRGRSNDPVTKSLGRASANN